MARRNISFGSRRRDRSESRKPEFYRFTLHWEGGTNGEVGTRTYSYQCAFKATNATVYKSGSWSDVKVGAHIKIKGEGQTVDSVEFVK